MRRLARSARVRKPGSERYASESASINWRISSMRLIRSDQVLLARRIHPIKTRRDRRRTRDPQMHLRRSRRSHHPHNLPRSSPANDRVVDQDDALPFQQRAHRIQLHPHAKVAHPLLRLDKRPPNIVVTNQPKVERNSGLRRISNRRSNARVRHRHHQIRRHMRLARQLPPHLFALFCTHRP